MKLVFPSGEHAPVDLGEGFTQIGSDQGCTVVVGAVGVAPRHCEIRVAAGKVSARSLDASAPTVLNGRQIDRETELKAGDLLLFGRVGCSVVASERKVAARAKPAADENDGRTRVRATLPRFMLRGVSGVTFGKNFAVTDNAIIGRQPDVDIPIPSEEISRQHARLRVTPEGLLVEDLGSANGTFIGDKRVQNGLLKPGEELRLDTVRFLLVAPGMDARQQSAGPRTDPVAAAAKPGTAIWVIIGVVVLAAVVGAAAHWYGMF